MAIGLGVPREALRLAEIDGRRRAIGDKIPGFDVTNALIETAESQRTQSAADERHRPGSAVLGFVLGTSRIQDLR